MESESKDVVFLLLSASCTGPNNQRKQVKLVWSQSAWSSSVETQLACLSFSSFLQNVVE